MQCTHQGYFKLAVNCDGVDLPSGGNIPAAVDTVQEVFNALEITKSFSADYRLGGKLVTFVCEAGCSTCGIIPEKKRLTIRNGIVVLDLPPEVAA
jgi:hypothetical protein